jgi:hypothetical protein
LILAPQLSQVGLLEFYRADETIAEGRHTVARHQAEIMRICERD